MTTKEKKQTLLLATTLVLLLIAGIAPLRSIRSTPSINYPLPTPASASDSSEHVLLEALRVTPNDSSATTLTQDATQLAKETTTISPHDSTQRFPLPTAPAWSDTLRRYGSHATAMQMLIELLEEKQLLMEEKVELARRLEITEILDSALVQTDAPSLSAAVAWDSLLASHLDSLSHKRPMPDSLPNENPLPPRP